MNCFLACSVCSPFTQSHCITLISEKGPKWLHPCCKITGTSGPGQSVLRVSIAYGMLGMPPLSPVSWEAGTRAGHAQWFMPPPPPAASTMLLLEWDSISQEQLPNTLKLLANHGLLKSDSGRILKQSPEECTMRWVLKSKTSDSIYGINAPVQPYWRKCYTVQDMKGNTTRAMEEIN